MTQKLDFDVDIDMADRDAFLRLVKHTPASIKQDSKLVKHNTGVYFQNIPFWPLEGFAAIDHKEAAEDGWFKVDFLNNSIYTGVRDNIHMEQLVNQEPMWELLEHEEIVTQLAHIGNHFDLVKQYKPTSIPQLAVVLAMIRPSKRYLVGRDWDDVESEVWKKPTDNSYFFKKSHAHAYALSIVVQLNLLVEGIQHEDQGCSGS